MKTSLTAIFILLNSFHNCLSFGEQPDYEIAPVNETGEVVGSFNCDAEGADFGDSVEISFYGCLFLANPLDACTPIQRPVYNDSNEMICTSTIVLIIRGGGSNCSFSTKVYHAQRAGYGCAIIYNNVSDGKLIQMGGGPYSESVYIPSFFVQQQCGLTLQSNYTAYDGYKIRILKVNDFPWIKYLVPFVAVFGICFLITLIALVVKLIRDKRKELRRRLSKRKLKKIPTKKYKKNETPETCPICLEDFVEGEKLRVLPCNHWYHVKCVDPWLTKNRKVCPVCKRKVLPDDSDSSDSETNTEEQRSSERRPLLSTSSTENYGTVASFPDAEASSNYVLSPPSSPETGSPPTRKRDGAPIVLGFTGVRSESNETLLPSSSAGITNPAYETPDHQSTPHPLYENAEEVQPSETVVSGRRENIV